jgi:hypothetical protein
MTAKLNRPPITFIPMSTDAEKIRFFGTLMPALLLLRASPLRFLQYQIVKRQTPRGDLASLIEHGVDDVAHSGDMLIFVHRWQSLTFDPFAFARAKTFLTRPAGWRAAPATPRPRSTRFRRTSTCLSWPRPPGWATSAPTGCWCTPSSARG